MLLYWHIGRRIGEAVLKGARADRGREILATLSQELTAEFGNGYSYSALTRMGKFVGAMHAGAIVATLRRQLSGRTQLRLSPNATARSLLQRSVEFRRLLA